MRPLAAICWWLVAASLWGCASHLVLPQPRGEGIELTQVPFVPQTTDQCGPAALSMALSQSGVQADMDDLRRRVHLPDRRGSLQLELVAASRQFGRIAYTVTDQPRDLFALLSDRQPVVVLQNLGARWLPIWHYAVVVGYQPSTDQFVLRSGVTKRKLMRRSEFSKRWAASDYWGLVIVAPDRIPVSVRPTEFLHAVSGNEALGQWHIARAAYSVATQRWPQNVFAHLGLGNAHLGSGDLDAAIRTYHVVLDLDSNHFPALNNLAYAYADKGDRANSVATIARALAVSSDDSQLLDDLRALRNTLEDSGGSPFNED